MRIYVGGLGSNVHENDLKKTFTSPQLGTVQSVEIIRTKGRSFAYLEFFPASDKGLAKLFSTYNGCVWKGGRLKLEKAKENYLCRLRREWEEDAQLEAKLSGQNSDEDESVVMQKPKKDQDNEKMQLKMFFPELRKIKAIPLKGTGKHKYSFQRVEIPPLPIHFCDCEEHSGPLEPAKRNGTDDHETGDCGVNDDELNMMKSILNKLLQKETCSETVANKAELTEEINHNASLADKSQVDENEEDEVSDEDNLVINMVGLSSKRVTLSEDWGLEATAANQDSLISEPESFSNPIPGMDRTEKEKHILDKKRKQSIPEDKSNGTVLSRKKGRKGGGHDNVDDQVVVNTQPMDKESGSTRLSCDAESSKKPAWRALVSEKGSSAFSISDVLRGLNSEVETRPASDHLATAPCSHGDDSQQGQSSKYEEMEKLSDVQPTKPSASADKSARGASWLQKSSWLQLVGDANTSTFSLAQILPDVTFEKQELQQSPDVDFLNLRSEKQHETVHEYKKSPIKDVCEPRGKANKNIYATLENPGVDVLTKGPIHGALDGRQLNSDSKETHEEDSSSSLMVGVNLVPKNRAVGDTVISETCPFMRSAASMKEWAKSKAALSGSHKKKPKEKESA